MTAGWQRRTLTACLLAVAHGLVWGTGLATASTSEQAPASAVASTAATALAQPTQVSPLTSSSPAITPLSNETTSTTWADPVEVVRIHERPRADSRAVAVTHLETEDGFPEVYLLLSSLTDTRGQVWVRLRIPGRPNGRVGWVPRGALGEFHVTHWRLDVSLRSRRLRAYFNGKLRFTAPVGVGKPSTPTPAGRFWIRERFKLVSRSNPYWPYALGTSDYSTLTDWPGGGVVGIHGDFGDPKVIPGDPSHGCVRMHDADIAWLAPRVQLGTPVHVFR